MKKQVFLFSLILSIMLSSVGVSAVTQGNDGEATGSIYGNAGYEIEIEGASFYDMAIPYNVTYGSIGGCLGSNDVKDANVGSIFSMMSIGNWAGSDASVAEGILGNNSNGAYDNSPLSVLRDKYKNACKYETMHNYYYIEIDGYQYLPIALGHYFYNSSNIDETGIDWSTKSRGQIVYLYFTKTGSTPKVVRCIMNDTKADGDTNVTNNAYSHLFQKYDGSVVELVLQSAEAKDFLVNEVFGLSEGYALSSVRMTNKILGLNDEKLNFKSIAQTSFCSTFTGSRSSAVYVGADSSEALASDPTTGFVGGYYKELDLSTYNELVEGTLEFANKTALSIDQRKTLSDWQSAVKPASVDNVATRVMRTLTAIMGLLITIYGVLLIVSFWFDKTNLFGINTLKVLSFGRFMLDPMGNDENCTWHFGAKHEKGTPLTVSQHDIYIIALLAITVGVFILSGTFFKLIYKLVQFIMWLFNLIWSKFGW